MSVPSPVQSSIGSPNQQSSNQSEQPMNSSANEHEDEDEVYQSAEDDQSASQLNEEESQPADQSASQLIEQDVAAMSSLGVRASRARRSLTSQSTTTPKASTESNTPSLQGKGMLLNDIPNVAHRIDKSKSTSIEFKRFLSLLFPAIHGQLNKNKLKVIARNHFNGLADDMINTVSSKLRKYLKEDEPLILSRLFALMDLEYEIDDEHEAETIERNLENAMAFLTNPQPTGKPPIKLKIRAKPVRKSGGRKRGLSKKDEPSSKKQRIAEAAKRSPNSFVIFMSAQRDELRAHHPEMTVQVITARLGEMWRNLPSEDREVYELAAQRLKEDAIRDEEMKEDDQEEPDSPVPPKKRSRSTSAKSASAKKQAPKSEKASKKSNPVSKEASESDSRSASDQSDADGSEDGSEGSASEGTQDEDEDEMGIVQ